MLSLAVLCAPRLLESQERGATALGEAVLGLGVNTRVLMVGAHPDDEDTFLIAWLSRGRHVTTAYLSLTRGDGGQNIIGNELGEALGVIRTEELLAARRIDGGLQYFTRAFDFGFSKDTVDTYRHWPKDSILGDVVRVVRAFRPHAIVAVFSGTPRDGHGQHQVSGLLAREAYDVAGDTMRFGRASHGDPWAPLKFYRVARGSQQSGTLGMDVGEYSPLLGRSFAEIAGESRSQHKSQGFGALERKGPVMNYVRREATRVNAATPAGEERSIFDGIDTTWARLRAAAGAQAPLIDSLPAVFAAVRAAYDPFAPERMLTPLARALLFVRSVCPPMQTSACERIERTPQGMRRTTLDGDLASSVDRARIRIQRALTLASGLSLEAVSVETWPVDTWMPVFTALYNRGRDTAAVSGGVASGMRPGLSIARYLAPNGVLRDTLVARADSIGQPWWLAGGRTAALFRLPASVVAENELSFYPAAWYSVDLGGRQAGQEMTIGERVVERFADDVKGEIQRPIVGVPAISLAFDQQTQLMPANVAIDRQLRVRLRSALADTSPPPVRVTLTLPAGLTTDTGTRLVPAPFGSVNDLVFRVRGRLPPGQHRIAAVAEVNGQAYRTGYDIVDYDHIRRQRIYRPAELRLSVVDARVPPGLIVAYVPGVSDNVAPALTQLGIRVTVVPAADLAKTSLSGFTTLVIGPRAYEASDALAAAHARVLDFARRGGTVVVQYGQYEMTQPGIMPFPITIARPHDRVTHEDAPVTVLDPAVRELTTPNRIGPGDFAGWVQERSLYMPRTFDPRYRPLLAMSDPGETPSRGAVLVADVGRGKYIYTSLAFFRQLPAGVPGAARLFVNLLSAGLPAPGSAR